MTKSFPDFRKQSAGDIFNPQVLSTDPGIRELFSQDIWAKGAMAEFVVSPQNTDQLSEIIKLAATHTIALSPRGGGMSYSKGYTPENTQTGILDLSGMDKILETNPDDMYVTVQAGCTWKTLYEALKPLGLRTPFWGPLSGISSTICGGLSQNNAFFGAGLYDTSTTSVTSLTVVLADGTVIKTGTGGTRNAKPFYRHYGPDLTGLFLGDSGSLGYKAETTLRLIPLPTHEDWASFEFDSRAPWAAAMAGMGRLGLACELFGFDPNLQAVRMQRAQLTTDVRMLANVIKQDKGGFLKGLREGARVAVAGRSYIDDAAYSLHFVVEGHSGAEVKARMDALKSMAEEQDGKEIENSIPKIIRANPFTPLNNILGPQGERWVPIHGIVAMSDGPACLADIDRLFLSRQDEIRKYDITTGYLLSTLSTNAYLIEPVFIWPEEIFELHRQTVQPGILKRIKTFDPNPEATDMVKKLRSGILDIFTRYGAAHFQIGRTYPYRQNRDSESWALLDKIKSLLDPGCRINPGSLGLD